MKRLLVPVSLLLLVALAGCSSASSAATTGASSAATAAAATQQPSSAASPSAVAASAPASAMAPTAAPATTSPTDAPSAAPAAGGTATDFCGAFKELEAVSNTPTGDLASAAAQFRAAAADMKKFAPAEIATAANTYADVIDKIGQAVASGSVDEASLSKALAAAIAGNAKDIATTATWVAKNCTM